MYNLIKKSLRKLKNRKRLGIIIAVVAAILVFVSLFGAKPGTAELVFYFPGGGQRDFSGEIVEGMTVFDAVLASVQGGGLTIDYSTENSVLEIKSVNDIVGEGTEKWHFSLNGETVVAAQIDLVEIKDGDKIEVTLVNAK